MGLDVYGYVMAAVPYDTVVTTREEVTEVTRYNEETGEPYIKAETSTKVFIDTEENAGGVGDVEEVLENLGLYCYRTTYEQSCKYVGITINEIAYRTPSCTLDPSQIFLRYKELEEKLAAIGITDAQPQIVFGLYYSY